MKTSLRATAVLALVGILDAIYGVEQHFGPVGTAKCNWGGRISCDIVNKSVFSEIAGVPVAVIGLLGYLAILAVSLWLLRRPTKHGARLLFGLAMGGLLFSFYLTFIEAWMLRAVCPICVVSQTVITAVAVSSYLAMRRATADGVTE